MALGLTPVQFRQLQALANAGARSEASAVNTYSRIDVFNANVLAILQHYGLSASKVKATAPGGSRVTHYWLTEAGLERLKTEAARG